ncbi:MAG: C4-type zinc ribbon domain-containing protein [candidate division Zixibacteria bacterium]|nr:C4-type zinc ribbon domain-containing protein [candidate division Zixibacteria bacterium]
MQSDLEMLLKLQVIDYDLGELERSKEYLPDMMENLRREVDETENLYRNVEKELTDSRLLQKTLELDLSSKQTDLKRLQEQMMAIKTNREYDALVSQIDLVKGAINEKETQLLELIEKVEKLQVDIQDFKRKAEEAKERNTRELTILQEKMDSVGSKIAIKEDERTNITVRIPKKTMSVYERVRKSRGGTVVVSVKKRSCGACYKGLPPHRIQEIKRGDEIITCDNCGRMLIWHDGESE